MAKLDGVATASAREISMKRLNTIMRRYLYKDKPNVFMKLELVEGTDPNDLSKFWVISRTGAMWDWLDRCPPPEWQAFFSGQWLEGKGVYTPVGGIKPPPRVGAYAPPAGPSGGPE
jgi:hypothetical protein